MSATDAPELTWESICNATGYKIYRKPATATEWSLLATVPATPSENTDPAVTPPSAAFNNNGAGEWRLHRHGLRRHRPAIRPWAIAPR